MNLARHLLALLLLALLAACGGGPDAQGLKQDVEARLAQALPAGTVTLEAVHRRGSQSDVKALEGQTRTSMREPSSDVSRPSVGTARSLVPRCRSTQ